MFKQIGLLYSRKNVYVREGYTYFTREGEEKDSYTACGEIISLTQCRNSCPLFE